MYSYTASSDVLQRRPDRVRSCCRRLLVLLRTSYWSVQCSDCRIMLDLCKICYVFYVINIVERAYWIDRSGGAQPPLKSGADRFIVWNFT